MHGKAIRREVREQLKNKYPYWNRLTKKEKKAITSKVVCEVSSNYDFTTPVETSKHELLGIEEQMYQQGIMSLDEMDTFVKRQASGNLFKFRSSGSHPAIKDYELRLIDELIDDEVINKILSYDGYSPAQREFLPSVFFRAELLKSIKFPEVSYRKFCGDDKRYQGHKKSSPFIGMECKQNRAFIGLPLNRIQMLHHVQLSQFRSSLTFVQLVNITVYFLGQLRKAGLLDGHLLHCVDSTELAVDRARLLACVNIKGHKIRIYDDIDCDCGARRTKRDKSIYVVGYRMHTLTAVHPETGHSLPLISLLAAANHHDSHFLGPLVALGNAIGLNIRLVSGDEAYHDKTGEIKKQSGAQLVTPPSGKVHLPPNVDPETMSVTQGEFCDTPMMYVGTESEGHEFKCGAEPGECPRACICPQYRQIPFDTGHFQSVINNDPRVAKALELRKHCERPFNLLKKREGLEIPRVRSQHGVIARATFATIATLLIEMAGTRKSPASPKQGRYKQQELELAA